MKDLRKTLPVLGDVQEEAPYRPLVVALILEEVSATLVMEKSPAEMTPEEAHDLLKNLHNGLCLHLAQKAGKDLVAGAQTGLKSILPH